MVRVLQHWLSASQELFLSQCPMAGELFGLSHESQSDQCCHSHPYSHLPQKTLSKQPPFPTPDITWVFTPIHSPVKCQHRNQGQSRDMHAPATAGLNSPSLPEAQHLSRPTVSRGYQVYHFASPDTTLCRIETPLPDQNCAGQHSAPTQRTSLSPPWGGSRPNPSRMQQSCLINCRKRHTHMHPSTLASVLLLRCPRTRYTLAQTGPNVVTCPFPNDTSKKFRTLFRTGLTSLPSHALTPAELPASLQALLLPFSCSHFLLTSGSRVGSAEILRSSLQTRKRWRSPEKGCDFQAEILCKHLVRGIASGPSESGAHPPHPPRACCFDRLLEQTQGRNHLQIIQLGKNYCTVQILRPFASLPLPRQATPRLSCTLATEPSPVHLNTASAGASQHPITQQSLVTCPNPG